MLEEGRPSRAGRGAGHLRRDRCTVGQDRGPSFFDPISPNTMRCSSVNPFPSSVSRRSDGRIMMTVAGSVTQVDDKLIAIPSKHRIERGDGSSTGFGPIAFSPGGEAPI